MMLSLLNGLLWKAHLLTAMPLLLFQNDPPADPVDSAFDAGAWVPIIMILVGPSIAMIAIWFVLAGFMPRRAEAAKENLPTVFFGVFLLSVAGAIVTALTTTVV